MTAASHPRRLGDRYELLEPIGYGGMGHVFRAHDVVLDREVAVKLLDAEAGVEDDSMRGAMDEGRLAAKLAHPGIAHVFDVGTQDDASYVVMELVPGRSLRELMRERGTFAAAEAIELGAQLADALHDAHRNGVVHCDVKPENIIVTPQGRTKLVDFGIARATAATRTLPDDEIRGSVAYLAPEQVRGDAVDGRTDVYALGAVLYELLTGRPPFAFGGQSAVAVATQRLVSDPQPPRSLNARIPVALQSVVMRALARDPADRYAHAAEMREALRGSVGETLAATHADTQVMSRQVIPRHRTSRAAWRARWSGVSAPRRAALVAVVVSIVLAGVSLSRLGPTIWQNQLVAPRLVGYRLAELPAVLEQVGLAPGEVSVITRPVEQSYVGKVVDQQPQPGQRLESSAGLQVAVGVPRR